MTLCLLDYYVFSTELDNSIYQQNINISNIVLGVKYVMHLM